MDYEIFLLSRVREARSQMNEEQAILAGMGQSGSIIAAAALMMILVFGSFAFARIVFTQLFGLGLAVAILLDATLIRAILAPALLLLAGRWNWWPGDRTDPKFPS
jgi:RND superfamily putative drug exporter